MATQGRAALLAWCKRVTAGYAGVRVSNFESSFRDGLAFCAIIHHYYPTKLAFDRLDGKEPLKNHRLAFDTASSLGVPALLDAEDMLPTPEPFSVMTYLMGMYNVFETGSFRGNHALSGKATPAPASGPSPPPPSNRTKRGTFQSPLCAACSVPLKGDVVEYSTKLYHAACFTCKQCNTPLRAVVTVDYKPHCIGCAQAQQNMPPPRKPSPRGPHAAPAPYKSPAPSRSALPSAALRQNAEPARTRRRSRSVGTSQGKSIKERIARLKEEQRQNAVAPTPLNVPDKPSTARPVLARAATEVPDPKPSVTLPVSRPPLISSRAEPQPPPRVPNRVEAPVPSFAQPPPIPSRLEPPSSHPPPSVSQREPVPLSAPTISQRDYFVPAPSLHSPPRVPDRPPVPPQASAPPPIPRRPSLEAPPVPARPTEPQPHTRPPYSSSNPFLHRSSTAPAIPPRQELPTSPSVARPSSRAPQPLVPSDSRYSEPSLPNRFDMDEYAASELLSGPLRKRDVRVLGISLGLAQVWCVLRAERLLYWRHVPDRGGNPMDSPLEGSISLRSCSVIISVGLTGFSLTTPERVYEFEAETQAERDGWVNGLVRAVDVYRKIEAYIGAGVQRREGYMDVKSFFGWKKKQYLVLNDGMLFLFLSKGGMRLSKLPLVGSTVTWAKVANSQRFAFEVRTESGTTALISSLVESEARQWMDAISAHQRHIDAALAAIVA